MSTLSELRSKARLTLGRNIFSPEWLYPMLVYIIGDAILGFSSMTMILALILSGPIYIGISKYYLGITRREIMYDNLSAALEGVRGDIAGNILSGFFVSLFTALWSLLLIIPGIVKSYAYRMTYFIKCDHPEYTALEAITESRKLMNGNKMRLFLLDLSFVGWYIVGIVCCAIGVFWVEAYRHAAVAEFYEEIKYSKIDNPFA